MNNQYSVPAGDRGLILHKIGIIIPIFILLVALGALYVGFFHLYTSDEIKERAVETVGVITRKAHERVMGEAVRNLYIDYRDGDDKSYSNRFQTHYDFYRRVNEGDKVDILYLPDKPSVAQLKNGKYPGSSWAFLIRGFGVIGTIISTIILIASVRAFAVRRK